MRQAGAIGIRVCGDPECRCVHIDFLGDNDVAFACAVINVGHIRGLIDDISAAAYEVMVTKEPHG